MIETPLTIRQQIEVWRDSKPAAQRARSLETAGLDGLYKLMQDEGGELGLKVLRSLSSPRTQRKLAAIGIDVDATWVAMAKYAVDPTHDWFPEVRSRENVVELFRPYYVGIGGEAAISRMFFDGRKIESIFRKGEFLPGMQTLTAMLRFCIDDQREGGARQKWNERSLFFLEGQWTVFGRGKMPLPELTGDEEFNGWFCDRVSHEQVDHVAKELNKALGADTFSPHLLIAWRKGNVPSKEKYAAFLLGVQKAFPEWLSEEGRTPVPRVEPPKEVRAVRPSKEVRIEPQVQTVQAPASPIGDVVRRLVEALTPSPAEQAARRAQAEATEALDRAQAQRAQILLNLIPDLEHALVPPPQQAPEGPGKVVDGFRFVLTADSFQPFDIFTLREAEDTERLLMELARRLAMINSMDPQAKRAVMARLRQAWDQLFIQVRHMDVADGDLPAMFQEMRLVAGQLGGRGLTGT